MEVQDNVPTVTNEQSTMKAMYLCNDHYEGPPHSCEVVEVEDISVESYFKMMSGGNQADFEEMMSFNQQTPYQEYAAKVVVVEGVKMVCEQGEEVTRYLIQI
tara:strand:- start:457 stop:762 length:306 start_codon:yes stop_codon:yes gene_type:complete